MNRYARQEILAEVGAKGQARLRAASALVVGAGGLGAPVLQYLAAAGLGQITVVDPDTVSLSNLHRQTLFRQDQIGSAKAIAAADAMGALNPDCDVSPLCQRLTPANVTALVAKADIVLDCADNFATSYCLSDTCLALYTPLISASALGLSGYVGGFCAAAPSLRAVFPDLPVRAATCATAGVMGPVVGVMGSIQAQMALNVLLGLEPSPLGKLVSFDLHSFASGGFRFDDAPEPDSILQFIDASAINSADFVVDLRSTDEAAIPATQTAQRLSVDDFTTSQQHPQTGQRAIFACRSGLRAWQAARHLQTRWSGEILLVAMGDPETATKGTDT